MIAMGRQDACPTKLSTNRYRLWRGLKAITRDLLTYWK